MLRYLHLLTTGIILLLISTLFQSCDKDMSIALNSDNIESLHLNIMDTMQVDVSTIVLSDIPTSGAGVLLLGKYNRPQIGTLSSNPYFQVEPSDFNYQTIPASAQFDSINLVLKTHSSSYFYGDTTKNHSISVHQLTKNIETTTLTSGGIFNKQIPVYVGGPSIFAHQSFSYDPITLGQLNYRPRPNARQTLSIKLDNAFGKDLFDRMKSNSISVSSSANFIQLLKGFTIIPDGNNTSLVAYSDSVITNIHYSYIGSDGLKKTDSKDIIIRDYTFKYNQFTTNRTGTDFQNLTATNQLSTELTNGLTYLQSGGGIAAKLNIPALKELMSTPNIAINKIELEVEVAFNNQTLYPLPSGTSAAPVLLLANENNIPVSFVRTPFSANIQTASFIPGNNTGRNAKYLFNLIEYIRSVNEPSVSDLSLVLAMNPLSLGATANSIVVVTERNKPKIKLNILYTKFK